MLFLLESTGNGTNFGTTNYIVPMRTKFVLRNYINESGFSPLYLHVNSGGVRKKINLDIYIDPKFWDSKKQRLRNQSKNSQDINLIIDNIDAKITTIRTTYRLNDIVLTSVKLASELKNESPRIDFIKFMQKHLIENKHNYKKGTITRHQSVIDKIRRFKSTLYFLDLNEKFINDYKRFCRNENNATNTINSNIALIKKYVKVAQNMGIKIPLNLSEIKVPKTTGTRVDLNAIEINKLKSFYNSDFISDSNKITLAYFLLAANTGLRISDLLNLRIKNNVNGTLIFNSIKTNKHQRIKMNKTALACFNHLDLEKIITPQHLNRDIKKIVSICGIKKSVSFHIARHTFATNYLRAGGKVERLQLLLGHSKIKETMIYVHIVEQEMEEDILKLDDL